MAAPGVLFLSVWAYLPVVGIIGFNDVRFDNGIPNSAWRITRTMLLMNLLFIPVSTAGATATMNTICQTSANLEKAMQVLEEFNTNVELYNLLSRGIQGEHWVWADEANLVMAYPEGVTADTSPYNPNTDWMFGNQFMPTTGIPSRWGPGKPPKS